MGIRGWLQYFLCSGFRFGGMTSVLYYYPIYDLDRSAQVVGGYKFLEKFVNYFFSKDIDIL